MDALNYVKVPWMTNVGKCRNEIHIVVCRMEGDEFQCKYVIASVTLARPWPWDLPDATFGSSAIKIDKNWIWASLLVPGLLIITINQ